MCFHCIWQNVISANIQLSLSVPTSALLPLEKITQVEQICGTFSLRIPASIGPSTLSQILPLPSGQLTLPSYHFKPLSPLLLKLQPCHLLLCLIVESLSIFFCGSSFDWNCQIFCHQTYTTHPCLCPFFPPLRAGEMSLHCSEFHGFLSCKTLTLATIFSFFPSH